MWRTATILSVQRNARHALCALTPTQECLLQARVGELPTVPTHRDEEADSQNVQQQKYVNLRGAIYVMHMWSASLDTAQSTIGVDIDASH